MVELARSGRRASEGVSRGEGAEEPRIEEMELWAQRACLRIAEVTVMHSVTTSATGSIATVIGLERLGIGRSMSAMVAVAVGGGMVWQERSTLYVYRYMYGHGGRRAVDQRARLLALLEQRRID
jgi:hypothetical protein